MTPKDTPSVALTIPLTTIFVVLATLFCLKVLALIAPLIFPLFFGMLLAVALTPLTHWLERKRCPRWTAIGLVSGGLGLLIFLIIALIIPHLLQQASAFFENLPRWREVVVNAVPADVPLGHYIERVFSDEQLSPGVANIQHLLGAGQVVLGGMMEVVLVMVFTVYLLIDGSRAMNWIAAFFTPSVQDKIARTRAEVSTIIFAYIFGQLITSACSFAFVLLTLSLLKVPSALLVASLAFVFDILPALGFLLTVVPAILFALNISLLTSAVVFGLFVLYHAVENYVLVPWVYGNRLQVSGLVVFTALLAGGLLAGIEGAIAALPIVASYPLIEKIWLKRYVSAATLHQHAKLE